MQPNLAKLLQDKSEELENEYDRLVEEAEAIDKKWQSKEHEWYLLLRELCLMNIHFCRRFVQNADYYIIEGGEKQARKEEVAEYYVSDYCLYCNHVFQIKYWKYYPQYILFGEYRQSLIPSDLTSTWLERRISVKNLDKEVVRMGASIIAAKLFLGQDVEESVPLNYSFVNELKDEAKPILEKLIKVAEEGIELERKLISVCEQRNETYTRWNNFNYHINSALNK